MPTIQSVKWETKLLLPIDTLKDLHFSSTRREMNLSNFLFYSPTKYSPNPDNFRFNDLTSPLSFPISKDFPETNFFSRPIFSLKFNKILKYRERDRQFHPSSFLILHPLCTYSNLSLSLSLGSIKRFQRTKLDNSLLDGRPRVFLDGRGGRGGGGGGGLFRNGSMHVVR